MPLGRWVVTLVSVFLLGAAMTQPAKADFAKATKSSVRPFCPSGSFFDPRKGGECWSCPAGTHRTIFPVTNGNACKKPGWSSWSKATFRGKAKTPKPRGAFYDPRKGGEWWRCPRNRPRRTLYPVTDARACATKNIIGERLSHAKYLGKVHNPKPNDAFYDLRGGGEYWSCPRGYNRTIFPVTAGNACEQHHPAIDFSARYVSKFGCPKGTFFDLRGGGECWSCPASHPFRTINPVTSNGACARSFGQIFSVDSTAMCKKAVAAIRDGAAAIEKFQDGVDKLTAPVTAPIQKLLSGVVPDIRSPKALRDVLAKLPLGDPRYQQVMAELERIATQNPEKLASAVMNPNVVCSGNARHISDALIAAGLRRDFAIKRASLFDGFPIGRAEARERADEQKQLLYVVSGSAALVKQNGPLGYGGAITIQIVTNLRDESRVYLSLGPTIAASKPGGKAAGAEVHREFGIMIFPHSAFEEGGPDLELGFDIARFNDLFGRYRAQLARLDCIKDTADKLPQRARKSCKWDADVGVAISFSPKVFKDPRNNIPGFGLSFAPHRTSGKIMAEEGPEVSFTGDYSFRLF